MGGSLCSTSFGSGPVRLLVALPPSAPRSAKALSKSGGKPGPGNVAGFRNGALGGLGGGSCAGAVFGVLALAPVLLGPALGRVGLPCGLKLYFLARYEVTVSSRSS